MRGGGGRLGRGVERQLDGSAAVAHRRLERGPVGVAPERRAPVLERAQGAQPAGPGLEVAGLAGAGDGPPDRLGALGQEADRPLRRPGLDDDPVPQVHEPDDRRPATERLLAQVGVEVDAPEPALLVLDRRRAAGLVVGDDELALGVLLQPVDDAPHQQPADLGLQLELQPDGPDRGRVLQLQVGVDQHVGVGHELRLRLRGEVEVGEVGIVPQLLDGAVEVLVGGRRGALRRLPGQEQLERPVDEGALGGVRAGRLGQLLDAGEAEGQRAAGERLDPGRREAGRHRVRHGTDGRPGVSREVAGPRPGGRRAAAALQVSSGQDLVGEGHDLPGDGLGILHGPEVAEPGEHVQPSVGQRLGDGRGDHPGRVLVRRPGHHEDRAGHLAQVGEGVLAGTALEDAGLLLGFAGQLDRAVRAGRGSRGRRRPAAPRASARRAAACRRSCRTPPAGWRTRRAGGGPRPPSSTVRPLGRDRGGRRWARRRPARRTCGAAPARP